MVENRLPGTQEDYNREAERGKQFDGSDTVKIGNTRHETTVIPLSTAREGMGYDPEMIIDYVIGHLARKVNTALDPEASATAKEILGITKSHEAMLEKIMHTWPIEHGDLVMPVISGYDHMNGSDTPTYKVLRKDIALPWYQIERIEGKKDLRALPYPPGSPEMEKTLAEIIGEERVAKVYMQIQQHIKYSQGELIEEVKAIKPISKKVDKEMQELFGLSEDNNPEQRMAVRKLPRLPFEDDTQ